MTSQNEAVLTGGPRDGVVMEVNGAALVEIQVDGMVHRYITTNQTRAVGDTELPLYTYDGMVNPAGAQDGTEDAEARRASPLADEQSGR
jgi:hypothetical protein